MANLQSAFGIFALLALAWIVSEDRRGVAWRQAAVALLVTFVTAVILLKVPGATRVFAAINDAVDAIAAASRAGTSFGARAAGLADRAGDERVDHAPVPLAHPAAARAWILLAAGAHAQGRRGGRALDR